MNTNKQWERTAQKRKILAFSLAIAFHLALFAVLFGGDFRSIKDQIKEKFKTEAPKDKA